MTTKRGRGRPIQGDPSLTADQRHDRARRPRMIVAIKGNDAELDELTPALDRLSERYGSKRAGVIAAIRAHAADL